MSVGPQVFVDAFHADEKTILLWGFVFPPICLKLFGAVEVFFSAEKVAPYCTVGGGADAQWKLREASIVAAPTPLSVKLLKSVELKVILAGGLEGPKAPKLVDVYA